MATPKVGRSIQAPGLRGRGPNSTGALTQPPQTSIQGLLLPSPRLPGIRVKLTFSSS